MNGCFKLFTDKKNWNNSEIACSNEVAGGHLASTAVEEDYNLAFGLLVDNAASCTANLVTTAYIGLNHWNQPVTSITSTEGFEWTDGQPYGNWAGKWFNGAWKEPNNNINKKNKIGFIMKKNSDDGWADGSFSYPKCRVCIYPL